ncbi:hypothetical protein [Arthrobacter cryoconiti]|uniref:Uncharacterized protein n=1 Tax=Arthrobacter cryoconiti TaxID=748907 RepID=A0ABV8QWN8_9MICC|nr:hypothetical protein [Arthrobacter cryoconiti]MCC9068832.1 hypothetical protein [Arthrobacter cryoconiti]
MKNPAQEFKKAQAATRAAREVERKALWALPLEDQDREYRFKRARTLHGSKEVEVDYVIDSDDLEELGYHHKDECPSSASRHDVDEPDELTARRALSDWHDDEHGNQLWAMCRQQPCDQLPHDFRSTP